MKARVESEAIYAALLSGALGGLAGLLLGLLGPGLPLAGEGSLAASSPPSRWSPSSTC
ncbi:hypothetical protein [Microbacterium aurantiacum]|uniref:hypothetical protein n=1 Tax=Microbacterium aurantiacum TaxID=162393 RepID=UPI00261727A6|nr:hypothetical protein [Microbacterium aurantiacum]